MARVELNEENLENVVGGAFRFRYDANGNFLCKVDGIGIFNAKESAVFQINKYDIEHPELTPADLVAWAKSQGLLWN